MAETQLSNSEIQAAKAQLSFAMRTYEERKVEVNSHLEEAKANLTLRVKVPRSNL